MELLEGLKQSKTRTADYGGRIGSCILCHKQIFYGTEYKEFDGSQAHVGCVNATNVPALKVTKCCATCKYWQGWYDNMFCARYKFDIDPFWKCADFEKCENYDVKEAWVSSVNHPSF